ncbi:MAG: (2E,6E)-farnesyl diphosphate synthase [Candidatus Competibacteraceae bacterium]|nr:(2E,6E)-farnesyl diphosphate synthase [Candidatus Competibacteraceae bacterium]
MDDPLIRHWRQRAQTALETRLPADRIHPERLHRAMRYAALGGGKRIRPVLAYATGHALGVAEDALDGPAAALELIHAYSLVHDDLPAMDDDDLRRGRPTVHRAFDEATAILVGDGLQALAFQILAGDPTLSQSPAIRLEMIVTLARAAGSRGMVGGQAIDLEAVDRSLNLVELENMHIHKTGALIRASVLMGALSCPKLAFEQRERLDHYAKCIGLAFQIQDDILDVIADTATLGKTQGADLARNKPTYPALLGLDEARQQATALVADALESLSFLGRQGEPLRRIASYIIERGN